MKDVIKSASSLRSQLAAGRPLSWAVGKLVKQQPAYAQFWEGAMRRIQNGTPLSEIVGVVWPEEGVVVVRAGESVGKLPAVLEHYCESLKLQQRLLKSAGRLKYPFGIVIAAVLVFIALFVTVVPVVGRSVQDMSGRVGDIGGFTGAGIATQAWLVDNWLAATVMTLASIVALVAWVRTPAVQLEAQRIVLQAPIVGTALTEMAFGLWTKYVAMSFSAGIPVGTSVRTTAAVLPQLLRPGVLLLADDLTVKHRALADAVDLERLALDDPRQLWPDYVVDAFTTGDVTGLLDEELDRVSPELVRNGEEAFDQFITISNYVAIAISAALVGATMLMIYLPMLSNFKNIR
ncbi:MULTISPECIES: type II secretion system F family protein [unclassified Stenotrophomonas]|nr:MULTISPECIES: type II secretion system F family protein [unclassified Stenotrophomonas]MDH0187664.1 type II secretion system F family protein [Stenotrophomonas sp. GD04051]MDH0877844.1 type II secretion system F family protein [Stenotrophomonas sp. GD03877]